MKPKSLIPLAVIVAILLGLVAYKKTSQRPKSIIEQTRLVRLLPEGFSKADVARIELTSGDKADEKLVLAYDKDADKWRVATHFNAPAKKETVEKYLDDIAKMKGEPRTMGASETALADYNLTDAKAFHVAGFKKDGTDPIFNLLVGKSPGYKEVFVRKAGSNDVFVEETNLKQQAGIYDSTPPPAKSGEKPEEKPLPKPEAGTWLDKEIVKVDSEKLTKVALTLPDKSLVFERREKPKPPADPAASPPAEEKKDEPAASSEKEAVSVVEPTATTAAATPPGTPEKKEYEWVLASGGAGMKPKPNSIETYVKRFAPLNATDIVDPAKKAEWGLETPAFVCVLSVEGQPDIRIEGGRPNASDNGYVRIADAKEDIVYSMAKYSFEQLFPKGTDFFDLPTLSFDKKTIDAISISGAPGDIALAREGDTIKVVKPACDLKPITTAVDNVVNTLASLRPSDYAEGDPGLGEPARTITFTAAGQPHTIKLYSESKTIEGSYVRIDDKPEILVLGKADVGKVFPAPNDLFERKLFDFDADDIAEIAVKSPAQEFSVAREGEAWKVNASGASFDADKEVCDDLAEDLASAQGDRILFGQAELSAPAETTIRVKVKKGGEFTLSCAPEKEGKREVKASGKSLAFDISASVVDGLIPALDKVKKPEPPPAPAETTTPATEPASAPAAEAPATAPEAAAPPVEQAQPVEIAPASTGQPAPAIATPQPPAEPVVVQPSAPPAEPVQEAAPESK